MPRTDRLSPEVLAPFLLGLPLGQRFHSLDSVTSTQDEARAMARDAADGTLVIAEEQTKGRGRTGEWDSPPGMGLWLSLILKPPCPPVDWPILTSLAGLSLTQTLKDLYDLSSALKWPNDVWVRGRKLAGVLAESQPASGWVILGMGINVHQELDGFPPGLRESSVSLAQLLGSGSVTRPMLLAQFLRRLGDLYVEFGAGGPETFRERLRERELTLGRQLRVRIGDEVVDGLGDDLGPRGELVLKLADGTLRELRTGHVELVSAPGET